MEEIEGIKDRILWLTIGYLVLAISYLLLNSEFNRLKRRLAILDYNLDTTHDNVSGLYKRLSDTELKEAPIPKTVRDD